MIVLRLATRSLFNRWGMVLLTVCAIALSVSLLVGVEKVRTSARAGFSGTISGTDLVMGARSGGVQLLLYAVFRIGDAPNNLTWQTYTDIAARPELRWIIPLSLGDSHRGYRVVGTTPAYFEHFRYRDAQPLHFSTGVPFSDLFDAVIGSEVAAALDYGLGSKITLSHGTGSVGFAEHNDLPFTVTGILAPTGTPVDKSIHVSLAAIEAIHVDWQSGAIPTGTRTPADELRRMDLTPRTVTAALIGLNSPIDTFTLQRAINQYPGEALSAVLPGMALLELWSVMAIAETGLRVVTVLVVATALLGMLATILAMLNERRREMAILRAVGARPRHIFGLLVAEAVLMGASGALLGMGLAYGVILAAAPWVGSTFGLHLPIGLPSPLEGLIVLGVMAAAALAGLVPAIKAYRNSLADGIAVRT